MNDILFIMLPPLVACLILTGIHTYLGLHVVSRGVIFVDLALAQIAALGSTFAFLMGFDPKSTAGYFYSLAFAFLGAAIFSLSRLKDNRVPQEALIGITFAVASSAAILIADRAPQGAEHVEEMLTGSILWISWPTIWKTLAIYSAVGLFHYLFRDRFLLISLDPEAAERKGIAVRWWDFLFYISFGFVITSSVAMAGILLVFSFLVIPSVIAMIYSDRIWTRLLIGWGVGTAASMVGLFASYSMDLPSGPSVVCSFGVFLVLAGVGHYVYAAPRRGVALARTLGAAVGLSALFVLALSLRPAASFQTNPTTQLQELRETIEKIEAGDELTPDAVKLLAGNAAMVGEAIRGGQLQVGQETVKRMGELARPEFIPVLHEIERAASDPWMKFYVHKALLELGEAEAIHALIKDLEDAPPPFLGNLIMSQLRPIIGDTFGYDPAGDSDSNQQALNRMEVWWHANVQNLKWDASTKSFRMTELSADGH